MGGDGLGHEACAQLARRAEPATAASAPLLERGGALLVTPLRNGPLQVTGNLELCAGTGRTVARRSEARLCRCGKSHQKPFCDLSHVAAGFTAEGS